MTAGTGATHGGKGTEKLISTFPMDKLPKLDQDEEADEDSYIVEGIPNDCINIIMDYMKSCENGKELLIMSSEIRKWHYYKMNEKRRNNISDVKDASEPTRKRGRKQDVQK